MAVVLIVQGRQYPVTPKGVTVGRGPDNTIVLADEKVSWHHARVWIQGTQVYVQDLGSTNGTFVNEKQISAPRLLKAGDRITIGRTTLQVAMTPGPASAPSMPLWPVLGLIGVVVLAGLLLLAVSRMPGSTPTPTPMDPVERARLATVMISLCLSFPESGKEYCLPAGSGSVVDARGYILTNHHVVEAAALLEAAGVENVAVTILISTNPPRQDEPVQPAYHAEILETNERLDLAILRITSRSDGRPLRGQLSLVSLPIGDSDQVRYGDEIRIFGYPAIGVTLDEEELEDVADLEELLKKLENQFARMTVTLTRGTVSGFVEDQGYPRGWIKTDAEISGGSSGGVAINEAGELIGVPTVVIAARDLGRLGYLRPINLARPLLNRIP